MKKEEENKIMWEVIALVKEVQNIRKACEKTLEETEQVLQKTNVFLANVVPRHIKPEDTKS